MRNDVTEECMSTDRSGDDHKSGLAGNAVALLTREAGRMPLVAVTLGLKAWEQSRPVRDLILRRGNEVLQIAAHTPLGRFLPQPVIDDGADLEAERIAADARVAAAAATVKQSVRSQPTTPSRAAVEFGAPGANTDVVEKVSEQLHIEAPSASSDLPIPDFDNISIGSLRARLRSLSVEDLVTLREWEKDHAHRLPVITLLDNRIAKVSAS
jgi:hypothetical protein